MHFHVNRTKNEAGNHDVVQIENGEVAGVVAEAPSVAEGLIVAAEHRAFASMAAPHTS